MGQVMKKTNKIRIQVLSAISAACLASTANTAHAQETIDFSGIYTLVDANLKPRDTAPAFRIDAFVKGAPDDEALLANFTQRKLADKTDEPSTWVVRYTQKSDNELMQDQIAVKVTDTLAQTFLPDLAPKMTRECLLMSYGMLCSSKFFADIVNKTGDREKAANPIFQAPNGFVFGGMHTEVYFVKQPKRQTNQ